MFILMTQLSSGDPIVEDTKNIREFYPEEVVGVNGESRHGTVVNLYMGEPWIVSQSVQFLYETLNSGCRGA